VINFSFSRLIVSMVAGLLMFGLLGGLGLLLCYSPAILEIDPASPGRAGIYKSASVFAAAGVIFGAYAYSRSLYAARSLQDPRIEDISDALSFIVGVPVALALMAFVPPESIYVGPDDVRKVDSLAWRLFIGLWVGVVGTSMTLRCSQFYSDFVLRE
jgi:hypothetical protein